MGWRSGKVLSNNECNMQMKMWALTSRIYANNVNDDDAVVLISIVGLYFKRTISVFHLFKYYLAFGSYNDGHIMVIVFQLFQINEVYDENRDFKVLNKNKHMLI